MADILLGYGRSNFFFDYDTDRFAVLEPASAGRALTDLEISEKLDAPTGTPTIEEIVQPGESVLIVVPDATRDVACGQVVNMLVRRLIANGTVPFDLDIIFATGIHRAVTPEEKTSVLTPFIAQRINTLDHAPRDISRIVRLGETANGIPVELNSALVEHDHVILIGGVGFHYFAGFTGGRKLICPGLASTRTISATHKLAFDCERQTRRDGVGTALLDGNPVHEAFVEAAAKAAPAFCISTIVDDAGGLVDLYCGDWITSHREACEAYSMAHTVEITEKLPLVVASCGGHPHDINLIQAHKALEAASHACVDGGTIILLAECRDGFGREDFPRWFEAADSNALAAALCEKYQVNGQTAWSLMRKTERFDVRIVTALPAGKVGLMRMKHFESLAAALAGTEGPGYIMPNGAKVRVNSGG